MGIQILKDYIRNGYHEFIFKTVDPQAYMSIELPAFTTWAKSYGGLKGHYDVNYINSERANVKAYDMDDALLIKLRWS